MTVTDKLGQALGQPPVGGVVGPGWPVEGQERAGLGRLPLQVRIGQPVQVAEYHLVRGHPELSAEQIGHVGRGRAELMVDADRRAGGVVRFRGRDHGLPRVQVQVMKGPGHLDQPGPGERCGLRSAVPGQPGIRAHAHGELLDEQPGQPGQHFPHRGLVVVVCRLVQAGSRDHGHAAGP